MRAIVEEQTPEVIALIIWLPMLKSDGPDAAGEAASPLRALNLTHYYDPEKIAGAAMAAHLGGAGRVAWDVYLVYGRDVRWEGTMPPPAAWLHQLGESSWADPGRYRWGETLEAELRAGVRALL